MAILGARNLSCSTVVYSVGNSATRLNSHRIIDLNLQQIGQLVDVRSCYVRYCHDRCQESDRER